MEVRKYTKEDYPTLVKWWAGHPGWLPVEENLLSTCGFIVDEVCAGFLYFTNSKAAILEWIISDPTATKERRSKGLDLLIDEATYVAKTEGYAVIWTWAEHPKLKSRLLNHMFVNAGDCTTYLRRV
ncbi:MAG: hypothetical protein KAS32_03595 [Candidatus Peribacteraceae bacterium]|nr:hypothetical protein [Candidatus Peribacteraceae bacterium]